MKKLLTLLLLSGLSVGCSKAPPAGTAGTEDGEDPSRTFWQLEDDSEIHVEVKPWPPSGGKATVEATTSIGDWGGDKPLVESIQFRVVGQENSSQPYQELKRTGEKTEGEGEEAITVHTYSAANVPFPKGTSYVQFKVKGKGFKHVAELSDWKVTY